MSKEIDLLNFHLAKGNVIDFNQLLSDLKNTNKINEDVYYKYLGVFHLQKENYKFAEENFIKSLNNNDTNFDTHLNLAVCYLKNNNEDKSYKHFERSLELKNDYLDTYILYSRALRNSNQDDKAVELLENGLVNVKSDTSKIIFEIAEVYRQKKEFLSAISNYSKLLKKNPANHILYNCLAVCYEAMGENIMAESNYLKAIKLQPKYFHALSNYGNLLTSLGKKNEALKFFEQCLNFKTNLSRIFRYISILIKFENDENRYFKLMQDYEKSEEFKNDQDKDQFYFALLKAYEDLKDDKSFGKYLTLANDYKRKQISNNRINKEFQYFDLIKGTFSYEVSQNSTPFLDGSNIILIVGMPRSGTTLVEQILGSHNKVAAGGEQVFFQDLLRKNLNFYNKIDFQKDFQNFESFKNDVGNEYLKKIKAISANKIITDKLPFNFFYIGFFYAIFKNIKIINLVRDPLDNCFSIYKNYFPEDINFAYDQKELSKYYYKYKDLMDHWNDIYKNKIFNLKYEDLIEDQKAITEKLLKYCNLEWDENCLNFFNSKSSVKTLSTAQVRQPIYKSSIKSWKKYEHVLGDLVMGFKN